MGGDYLRTSGENEAQQEPALKSAPCFRVALFGASKRSDFPNPRRTFPFAARKFRAISFYGVSRNEIAPEKATAQHSSLSLPSLLIAAWELLRILPLPPVPCRFASLSPPSLRCGSLVVEMHEEVRDFGRG